MRKEERQGRRRGKEGGESRKEEWRGRRRDKE